MNGNRSDGRVPSKFKISFLQECARRLGWKGVFLFHNVSGEIPNLLGCVEQFQALALTKTKATLTEGCLVGQRPGRWWHRERIK